MSIFEEYGAFKWIFTCMVFSYFEKLNFRCSNLVEYGILIIDAVLPLRF